MTAFCIPFFVIDILGYDWSIIFVEGGVNYGKRPRFALLIRFARTRFPRLWVARRDSVCLSHLRHLDSGIHEPPSG
jgi:hypothetical protein